jgi:hypothetical protein
MASRMGWMPTFRSEEAGKAGKSRPVRTASPRPFTRSSWGSVPFSKNSSISDSLVSATSSTSFSRSVFSVSRNSGGTSTASNFPLWSSV